MTDMSAALLIQLVCVLLTAQHSKAQQADYRFTLSSISMPLTPAMLTLQH